MGNKKGGKGTHTYDRYGTIAGVCCWGPADILHAVIVDGRTIVTGPIALTAAATDLIPDPDADKYLDRTGRITIYRGTQTTADPALSGHPPYQGLVYIVLVGLLFGRERYTAPNVQVVLSRKPVADTSLVSGGNNLLTSEGHCNPVAALVEVLTGPHGLGIPVAAMEASSWQAAAAWAADPSRSPYAYCSMLLNDQEQARQRVIDLLTMLDAVLYWTASGTLAIALLKPGVAPSNPPTIDARHVEELVRIESPGWADVPTSQIVRYQDAAAQYKERTVKLDNLLALRTRGGVPNTSSVDRPCITSTYQAALHAAEALRRASKPSGEIEIKLRRPFAAGLHPGAKIRVDVDPEPGGSGLAQLCVVQDMREGPVGGVDLVLRPDTLVDAVPYSPAWVASSPQAADCPPIVAASAVVVPLPIATFPTPSFAVLAPRPAVDVVSVRVYLSEDGSTFADLGGQSAFACRASLVAGIGEDDGSVGLTLPDGVNGPDAYLAEMYPTTAVGAGSDELLLVIANLDLNGRVVITGGAPEMEICSIQTRALVGDPAVMTYTILRARLGTANRAWTTGAKAWITVGSTLTAWSHEVVQGMVLSGAVGYVRLVAATVEAEDQTVPIPERTFLMPVAANSAPRITWVAPSSSKADTDSVGAYTVQFHVDDSEGDLMSVEFSWRDTASGDSQQIPPILLRGVARFPDTGEHVVVLTGLAPATYELVVSARDRRNPTVVEQRTLFRPPTVGTVRYPPSFSPPGKVWTVAGITVTITVESPADRIEYLVADPGAAAPASGTTHMGTSKAIALKSSRRIWARAGTSTGWSAWAFADYRKEGRPGI